MKQLLILLFICVYSANTQAQMSGTYTVGGANPDYESIGLAVVALNSAGVNGSVVINIRPGVYQESFQINNVSGTSNSNTVKFKSESGIKTDVVIRSATGIGTNNAVIVLKNSNHITLEGLSIEYTGTNKGTGVYISEDNTCTQNTVNNCIVRVPYNELDDVSPIFEDGSNNFILNNHLYGGSYGLRLQGNASVARGNYVLDAWDYGISVVAYGSTVDANYVKMRKISTTRSGALGIHLSAPQAAMVSNNMVAGGFQDCEACYGIKSFNAHTSFKMINNTIIMDSENFASAAYTMTKYLTYPTDIYNNIFYNTGSGLAYIIDYQSSAQDGGLNSDNNSYYTNGAVLARWKGILCADLAELRAANSMDANSISVKPIFVSETDLHTFMPAFNAKGKADPLVAKDFDGDTRNASTPDIGADEFDALTKDLAIRKISVKGGASNFYKKGVEFLLLNNGNASLNGLNIPFTLESTITGSVDLGAFNLYSLASFGDSQRITVPDSVLIDVDGPFEVCVKFNDSDLPDDGLSANNSLCNSYCHGLRDTTFTVGVASGLADFSSLQKAIDYLTDSLFCGISGNIDLLLEAGTYGDPITLREVEGMRETAKIRIRSKSGNPADVTYFVTDTTEIAIQSAIKAFGVGYYEISGITFNLAGKTTASAIQIGGQAQHIRIENCHFIGDDINQNKNQFGITISELGNHLNQSKANNIEVVNNEFFGLNYGVYVNGGVDGAVELVMEKNQMERIHSGALFTVGAQQVFINGNAIDMSNSQMSNASAISVSGGTGYFEINNNQITGIASYGVLLAQNGNIDSAILSNNMIGKVRSSQQQVNAIYVQESKNLLVAHNSIHLSDIAGATSAAFYIANGINTRLLNNIFVNKSLGFACNVRDASTVSASNHNVYYSAGDYLAYWGQPCPDFTALKTASTQDGNSFVNEISFIAEEDLHSLDLNLVGKGKYLPQVALDIDGDVRENPNPCIGADEFVVGKDLKVVSVRLSKEPVSTGVSQEVIIEIKNSGTENIVNPTLSYSINGVVKSTLNVSATLLPGQSLEKTFADKWTPLSVGDVNVCGNIVASGDLIPGNDQYCTGYHVQLGTFTDGPKEAFHFDIFPNPSSNLLHIRIPERETQLQLVVYDLLGKKMLDLNLKESKTVSLEGLKRGTYLVELSSKEQRSRKVLVLQ